MIFLGERLKQLRKQEKYTQKQIGDVLNICNAGYSDYERGKAKPPIEKLVKLAEILHTSVQYIVTGKELSETFDKEATPFPQRLRELREQKNMTQQQVADYLGIRKVTYQEYEYDKYEPKVDKLLQLAELFNVTLDELMGRNKR